MIGIAAKWIAHRAIEPRKRVKQPSDIFDNGHTQNRDQPWYTVDVWQNPLLAGRLPTRQFQKPFHRFRLFFWFSGFMDTSFPYRSYTCVNRYCFCQKQRNPNQQSMADWMGRLRTTLTVRSQMDRLPWSNPQNWLVLQKFSIIAPLHNPLQCTVVSFDELFVTTILVCFHRLRKEPWSVLAARNSFSRRRKKERLVPQQVG